jgi:hypothetical protein
MRSVCKTLFGKPEPDIMLEVTGDDGTIILKWILKKRPFMVWTGVSWLWI